MNKSMLLLLFLLVTVSLVSGLLFSFSIAVSPGLKLLPDIEFIKAMKSINKKILNALFFICFFSPVFLFPLVIYSGNYFHPNRYLLVLGFLLYICVIGITGIVNVPLNNQLEQMNTLYITQKEAAGLRRLFEYRWTYWNNIRTIVCIASLLLVIFWQSDFNKGSCAD